MEQINKGKVVWFNNKQGFGFLEWHKDGSKQKDMFVHFTDIDMSGFKTLKSGDEVQFEIGENFNGIPKAIKVVVKPNL